MTENRGIPTLITPEMAKKWLDNNSPTNRPLDRDKADAFVQEILEDKWRLDGSTITVENGVLTNGQHRMTAIIESGKAVTLYVLES